MASAFLKNIRTVFLIFLNGFIPLRNIPAPALALHSFAKVWNEWADALEWNRSWETAAIFGWNCRQLREFTIYTLCLNRKSKRLSLIPHPLLKLIRSCKSHSLVF